MMSLYKEQSPLENVTTLLHLLSVYHVRILNLLLCYHNQADVNHTNWILVYKVCQIAPSADTDCIDKGFKLIQEKFELGDDCIENFHLARYIFGDTSGNFVLRRSFS